MEEHTGQPENGKPGDQESEMLEEDFLRIERLSRESS